MAARSYGGVFEVRIPPFLQSKLALEAASDGVSLNRLISAEPANR
ncbi:MAG: toxin-antitoxin system HicB family antitoxin [Deltaproteobacteria bacterium]|nr:toxin-antitoxin system HicB family antitoxin [Deltaproteobacteria bacterium]